ncbi:MAG TPA: Zn-dependent hydrolase [Thermomicrobiales bacterium]|nr:Zn-dependent hydrolase [Thermomicrobiales bacterium]
MRGLASKVMRRADELARFSSMEHGICRIYGTPEMRGAMDRVEMWMHEAGMTTERDAFGSLVGTYGGETDGPPFVLGGHLDSVRDAGRYDGILGVLSGIAVVESLSGDGRRLPFPLKVVAFADEEGVRFRTTLIASRVWSALPLGDQLSLRDAAGTTLSEAIRGVGGGPDALPMEAPKILGFLETHIEQGPVLEAEDLPVGVVTSIVASKQAEMALTGMAGHAGTVPMSLRRDALAAASEIVLAVERIARSVDGMVGTVGELHVQPGAPNVVPGGSSLTVEVRHPSVGACHDAMRVIQDEAVRICKRRGIELAWRDLAGYDSTPMDAGLVTVLGEAIAAEGIRVRQLPSGAGHDAVNIAQIAPVAMLFVRCEGGISHNPAESIMEADVSVALRVVRGFLERVAATR